MVVLILLTAQILCQQQQRSKPETQDIVKRFFALTWGVSERTPAQEQEYDILRPIVKKLGAEADRAWLDVIQDIAYWEVHPFCYEAILHNRDLVPEAVPLVRKIVMDYLSKEKASSTAFKAMRGALEYLLVWGDDSDIELMRQSLTKAAKDENPTQLDLIPGMIKGAKRNQQLRAEGKLFDSEVRNMKTRFHEWAYTNQEWLAMHPPPTFAIEVQISAPIANTPEAQTTIKPPLKSGRESQSAPQSKSWLVWLFIVIAATGSAVWVFSRKSK